MKNGGGHFAPELGGHFELESGGHFKLELGGQYHWNLHSWTSLSEVVRRLSAACPRYSFFNTSSIFSDTW